MLGYHRSDDELLSGQCNGLANVDGGGRDAQQVLAQDQANIFSNRRILGLTPSTSFSSVDGQVVFPPMVIPATAAAALSQPQFHQSQGFWSQSTFIPEDSTIYPAPIDISNTAHIFPALGDTSLGLFPPSASHELSFPMSQDQPDSQPYYVITPGVYASSQASPTSLMPCANSQTSSTPFMPYVSSQSISYHTNTQPQYSSHISMDSAALAFNLNQQPVPRVKRCSNCNTTETPTWRRHPQTNGQVCNACGLYFKLHMKNREFTINSHGKKTVKRQPRGSGNRAQRSRVYANTLELTSSGAPVARSHMAIAVVPTADMEYVDVPEYDMANQPMHHIPSPPKKYKGHPY